MDNYDDVKTGEGLDESILLTQSKREKMKIDADPVLLGKQSPSNKKKKGMIHQSMVVGMGATAFHQMNNDDMDFSDTSSFITSTKSHRRNKSASFKRGRGDLQSEFDGDSSQYSVFDNVSNHAPSMLKHKS